jgi:hypothetical protein
MAGTDTIGSERLEALLAGAEPCTAAEARRVELLAELRRATTTLLAPEPLRARVLAQRPARARLPRPLLSFRPRALVLVAVVLAFALGAAAVHGVVSPQPRTAAGSSSAAEQAAPTVTAPDAGSSRTKPAPSATQGSSRASRMLRSALRFLALEGLVVIAVLVVAAAGLGLARARRGREERRLLGSGTSPPGRRGDLME